MMDFLFHPGIVQIIALILLILVVYPSGRILQRMGFSGWWALILAVPGGGLLGLWILAFSDWPALHRNPS